MKDVLDTVPTEFLRRYINVIRTMDQMRGCSVEFYGQLDAERRRIHLEILKSVNTDKDNRVFCYELAKFVETWMFLKT
jgi:hypothetical protein